MGGLFRFDSKPMRFLSTVGDLILLNLLTVICSLPVFTVGASVSALYAMTFRMRKDGVTDGILRGFLKAFGQNFKKGTLLWLLYAAAAAALFADYLIISEGTVTVGTVWKAATAVIAVLYAVSFSWIFALQARFENSISQTFRNSLLLAFTNLRAATCAAALTAAPWIFWYFKTDWCLRILPLWLMLLISGIAYLKTMLFEKIFDRYAGSGEAAGETVPPGQEKTADMDILTEEEKKAGEAAPPES